MSYEEDDFSRAYEYIELARNTGCEEIAGRGDNIWISPRFNDLGLSLANMEKMVHDIHFSNDGIGFDLKRDRCGRPRVVRKSPRSERYFYALGAFLKKYAFPDRHVYSPHVEAVNQALEALDLQPSIFAFDKPGSYDRGTGKTHGEFFNDVVAKVAEVVGSSQFRERLRARRRNAERNEAKGLAIEQKVFEAKSRHLVLMLHFGYKDQYRSKITLEEIQKHRKKFFNNSRMNQLLLGITDYIWKMEEGDESGLHLHVLIFYSADSCHDVYIAKLIGDYWVQVTEGKGQYWNSNANKRFHEKYGHGIGTGEIDWHEEEKREALRKNIRYMTKADQFLRIKYGVHCRLFGTSQPQEKKKAGRPRRLVLNSGALDDATKSGGDQNG